jgi:hypothetical protein
VQVLPKRLVGSVCIWEKLHKGKLSSKRVHSEPLIPPKEPQWRKCGTKAYLATTNFPICHNAHELQMFCATILSKFLQPWTIIFYRSMGYRSPCVRSDLTPASSHLCFFLPSSLSVVFAPAGKVNNENQLI